ncbi:MAG: UPF0164 family protein [Treponema sp.]|nr:UPF0164 family protein [Treponema sp.]
MFKKRFTLTLIIFSSIFINLHSLSYDNFESTLSEIFDWAIDDNEGETAFRSLLIPFGGRSESMGEAYTGLADDISFLQYNAAASSVQGETQLSVFHNSWIADSKLDAIAYTTRFGHLGLGTYFSSFYLPFTEYNLFGERVASNYYSESFAGLNISYNFLAGYNFKGLALGANVKAGWRSMPDFTDNESDEILTNSGLEQSAFAALLDLGLMMQFNFLKYYSSRQPNVRIGLSAQNLGFTLTGFASDSGLKIDEGLSTIFAAGISLKPIKPLIIAFDFKQPVNFFNITTYLKPYFCFGAAFQFTKFASLLGGFEIKGGNPKISAGFEFEILKVRLNFNYSLDLTSSFNPLNKISISAKLLLGDRGRAEIDALVDEYYQQGLAHFSNREYEEAIRLWQEALKLNKRFDPAILGIETAQFRINMLQKMEDSIKL